MKPIYSKNIQTGVAVLGFLIAGCTGSQLNVKSIPLAADPVQQLTQFEQKIDQAREEKVHVLSPIWFSKAEESYWEAKTLHNEGGELKIIFKNIALGEAQLQKANNLAPIAKMVIGGAIEARSDAINAGANELTKGFIDAERKFLKLTRAIEQDDRKEAEEREEEIEQLYRDVELTAIKDETLRPVRGRHQQLKEIDAKRWVRQPMHEANETLAEAVAFIEANRYDDNGIKEKVDRAIFLADRALNLTQKSKTIKNQTSEETVLQTEATYHQLAKALELPDMRNLPFESQLQEIHRSIRNLQETTQKLLDKSINLQTEIKRIKEEREQQIARLQEEKQEETKTVAKLKENKAFQEKFDRIQEKFNTDEAEVYKESGNLVLRLKGIQFRVGKAVLLSENYPLLTKVQDAIRQFNNPLVIVEGHTDSTGSSRVNKIISETRAREVRNYLVSHGQISEDQVQAVGYGFNRPIATNRTKEGRAKNRRIDVIIKPQEPSS